MNKKPSSFQEEPSDAPVPADTAHPVQPDATTTDASAKDPKLKDPGSHASPIESAVPVSTPAPSAKKLEQIQTVTAALQRLSTADIQATYFSVPCSVDLTLSRPLCLSLSLCLPLSLPLSLSLAFSLSLSLNFSEA